MPDLYYHLHDEDSRQAMMALAQVGDEAESNQGNTLPPEATLRATGQSTIEKTSEVPEVQELVGCLNELAERAGFEPARQFCDCLHAFQACSFGLSDTSPSASPVSRYYTA